MHRKNVFQIDFYVANLSYNQTKNPGVNPSKVNYKIHKNANSPRTSGNTAGVFSSCFSLICHFIVEKNLDSCRNN